MEIMSGSTIDQVSRGASNIDPANCCARTLIPESGPLKR